MDLHTKQKIFEQLKITDKFIIKVLLTIDTDYLFIKESLKNSQIDQFNEEDFQKVQSYLKDYTLEELIPDIPYVKKWQEYLIPIKTIPTDLKEEYEIIGSYLLYCESDFILENFFYTTYDFENIIDLLSEIKVAEHILDSYKYSIIYEPNVMKLHIFSY
ncbi:hypothetical protein HOK00_07385 [bacterium]|jgi:hypothetical protein|nr:hypothetical protein [bacterium]